MRKIALWLTVLIVVAFIIGIVGYGYAQEESPGGGGGAASCCGCASAYASVDDGRLDIIREFRDKYLMTNPTGQLVASLYYDVFSPPIARFINDHPAVKPYARAALTPVVALSTVAVDTTWPEKIGILGFLALASGMLILWVRRRRSRKTAIAKVKR